MDSLDRIIPPDEAAPLQGPTFLAWERQTQARDNQRQLGRQPRLVPRRQIHLFQKQPRRHLGDLADDGEVSGAIWPLFDSIEEG